MRFNGVDLLTVHGAVSRAIEIPPGMAARDIATTETADGELVVDVYSARDEYTVRVNIAARSYEEAMEARLQIAAWAAGSGKNTARLEPTYAPGMAYDAIVKNVGKLEKRFTTLDVVFLLPKPVMYEITPQIRTAASAKELAVMVGGSAPTRPVIAWKPEATASTPRLMLDGEIIFALQGTLAAGQELEIALETASVTVDGVHAEERILYTEGNPDASLTPGKHTLSASAAGEWAVRWHNRWQ